MKDTVPSKSFSTIMAKQQVELVELNTAVRGFFPPELLAKIDLCTDRWICDRACGILTIIYLSSSKNFSTSLPKLVGTLSQGTLYSLIAQTKRANGEIMVNLDGIQPDALEVALDSEGFNKVATATYRNFLEHIIKRSKE